MSRKLNQILALGLPTIDKVFLGFHRGDFVVLFGHPICRRLAFLLSVRCQLPLRKGGLNSRVIYIDGGNTFDPYHVSAMAQEFGWRPKITLERILISRAFTAYQLTALVFRKLEVALKKFRSKLVIISDISKLFLDQDVPKKEGRHIFMKMTRYLSELASTTQAIIVATYFPQRFSSRSLFLKTVLFERADTVIELKRARKAVKFVLEKHPDIKPFAIDFPSDVVTIDMFVAHRS